MTIVVIGVMAVPLSLLLSQHIESVFQSEDDTTAAHLARLEIEKAKNIPFDQLTSASFPNYLGYRYDVLRTVRFIGGGPSTPEGLKEVRVEVKKAGGSKTLVSFFTYSARNVQYGV